MRPVPLFADERTAAQLFDMTVTEFRKLVEAGHLPRPRDLGEGMQRYNVEELRRIASGEAVEGGGTIPW